jgi:TP901 family phage tail tape measure protein
VELFADDSKLQRGLKRASRSLKTWGASAMRIGAAMTAASTAMLAPVAMATRTFMGFEDQMKAVQAVTGATGDQFERLYEKAKELGRTTSFTAAEVAAGMLNLARAGFSTSEINAAIAGMLNLARATGTDLAQATEIAAGTLRAFNLAAGDSTRVADVLVATANNSAQTLEELGESMTYAAPIAHEYGLTLEETAKALGVMANMQIKGSMAGTSMRQAMLRLADPKVQKQIEALGVSVTDLSGNMRTDFGTMMLELGQAMKGMTSGQRLSLIKDLFDQRALPEWQSWRRPTSRRWRLPSTTLEAWRQRLPRRWIAA